MFKILVCSPTSKCKNGQGHCSIDSDCREGLKCGSRNCNSRGPVNCCYKPEGIYACSN